MTLLNGGIDSVKLNIKHAVFTARNEVAARRPFSQASVILFTGGPCVGDGGMHGRWERTWHWGMCGRGVHGRKRVWQVGGCVAGETATAVGGRHPTGMHYCIYSIFTIRTENDVVFFLSLCVNSNIGNHTTHFKSCIDDIKNLCHCRQEYL